MSIYLLNARAPDNSVAEQIDPPSLPANSRIVVLIHGYNNDRAAAEKAYGAFATDAALDDGTRAVCEVFWPGDKRWGPVSFASYPLEIKPAVATAKLLEAYIAALPVPGVWPLQVVLICHSLGNRVGLEIMSEYINAPERPQIDYSFCSMAAAVPVRFVELGGTLLAAAMRARGHVIMYSRGDRVLHWGFPIGETLAGEGFFPSAVGRHGEPAQLWGPSTSYEMSHAGGERYQHGDYWPGTESAEVARAFLSGVPVPPVASRATDQSDIPSRTTPLADTPARALPTRPSF